VDVEVAVQERRLVELEALALEDCHQRIHGLR
jgi:hypothetical protein